MPFEIGLSQVCLGPASGDGLMNPITSVHPSNYAKYPLKILMAIGRID
jgi:hypothetical protein